MRRIWIVLGGFALTACGAAGTPAHFEGSPAPALVGAGQVREVETVPRGYDSIGRVVAGCNATEGRVALHDAPLSDVDCSEELLVGALREQAAAAGGELLADRTCTVQHAGGGLAARCSAEVARPSDETLARRPLACGPHASAPDQQPPAVEAWRVLVDFTPSAAMPAGGPRRGDLVRDVPRLPVSHVALGSLITHCDEGCTEAGARAGMRVAAGRVGATDVAGVRCVAHGRGWTCTGTPASYRRAPENLAPASW